tara:strand:+ start:20 stop:463 length:444 start_codon:yes stop_codon:yes gene_type:complete
MNWRKNTEDETQLFNKLCKTSLVPDRWGKPVIDDIKLEAQWLEEGKTKAELVNTFAHLRCEALMEVEVNDTIQMSTQKEVPDCYKVAEISFTDNRIRFYQKFKRNGSYVPFNETWPLTRYPYLAIERKANERKQTKEEKKDSQIGLF